MEGYVCVISLHIIEKVDSATPSISYLGKRYKRKGSDDELLSKTNRSHYLSLLMLMTAFM